MKKLVVTCIALVVFCAQAAVLPVRAVPSFAAQTGQPCSACHVGSFGPQLTPFGRAFKIGGYTQEGGDGPLAHVPLAAMALSSFNRTNVAVPSDQITHHYGANENFALDQVSAFFAGRLGLHTGALCSSPIRTSRTRRSSTTWTCDPIRRL